jgi:hypothetical protein
MRPTLQQQHCCEKAQRKDQSITTQTITPPVQAHTQNQLDYTEPYTKNSKNIAKKEKKLLHGTLTTNKHPLHT